MPWVAGVFSPDAEITCVDCGGTAHLLPPPAGPDDLPWAEGHHLVYRCAECHDRWDLEVPADDSGG